MLLRLGRGGFGEIAHFDSRFESFGCIEFEGSEYPRAWMPVPLPVCASPCLARKKKYSLPFRDFVA
jgi:hypothetical protein